MFGGFSLDCFAQVFIPVVCVFNHSRFLVIFDVNLRVIFVLAASSPILALHSSLLNITLILTHESGVLPIQGVLKLQPAVVRHRCEIHFHELGAYISVHVVSLGTICVNLGKRL
jgi:hypothetical protein